MLKLIACIDEKNGIGKDGIIPWKNKDELLHFKNITENNIVVMGLATYYSIGHHLSNRQNIVLSNNSNLKISNVIVINDYKEIIQMSKEKDVFIIGGSQIYKLFEHYYDELIISKINGDYECNEHLKINLKFYELVNEQDFDSFSVKYYKSFKDKIIYGSICCEYLKYELINLKNNLVKQYKKTPRLKIIQVGDNYASNIYIKNKTKLANNLGIICELIKLPEITSQKELIRQIQKDNKNKNVHGILLQLPLPKHINENEIFKHINVNKDVDCFNPENIGLMWLSSHNIDNLLLPCTSRGIIELLKYNNIELESKKVVIIGRSNIVSKPLISLFLFSNCTVTICHSKTKNLKEMTKQADIVITSIGKSNFFDKSYFNKNSIIIDVGINRNQNNEITGDVNFLDVIHHIKKITPVPYGVGPMTLISLFKNLLICYIKQNQKNK